MGKLGLPVLPIQYIVFGMWSLTLVQQVVPVIQSLSWRCLRGECKYEIGSHTMKYSENDVINFCGESQAEDAMVALLSEASGMASLQCLNMANTENQLRHMVEGVASGAIAEIAFAANLDLFTTPLCNAMQSRVVYSFVFENCVQLNIQCTLFAIYKSMSKHSSLATTQASASILLSLLMAFLKLT